jgi:hypothetical protein
MHETRPGAKRRKRGKARKVIGRRFVSHDTRRDRQRVARLEDGLATVLPGLGKWYVNALAGLAVSLSVGGMLGVRALAETLSGSARLKHRVKRVWRFLRNRKRGIQGLLR